MRVVGFLDYYDKLLSDKIHSLELPKYLEFFIYLCARLFNPDFITSYLIIIFYYKYLYFQDWFFVIKPLVHVLSLLIITLILKSLIARPRPNKKKLFRLKDLRENEKNCSMPSGDSLQCANFCIIMFVYFNTNMVLYILPFVMFSRIYYFCHYIMDTLIGAALGLVLSYLVYIGIN